MITNFETKNFKSIGMEGIKIDLRPLTIFLGPNGSGKSSILESIGVLCQSAEKNSFQSDSHIVKIEDKKNIFYKKKVDNWVTFEIQIKLIDNEIVDLLKKISGSITNEIQKELHEKDIGYRLSYKQETDEYIQIVMIGNIEIAKSSYIKIGDNSWQTKVKFKNKSTCNSKQGADRILSEDVFKPIEKLKENYPFSDLAIEITKLINKRILNHIFLISAVRGQTEFKKQLNNQIDESVLKSLGVGTYGENLIPILSLIQSNREYETISEKINKWASKFGINKFSAGWKGGYTLGSNYIDNELDVILNLAQASHGSKQILSVITQLFWSDPDSIIMIEEPEISLHPNSQAHLAELFAEAIHEGKQIIITTHSEFLPLTLSIPIQSGMLKIEDIAIYHVEKQKKGSTIKKLELTSKGYVKNWIPSFAELEEKLLEEWIKTVPEE